jgi:predicted alpha/beta-hydrolase family hydrolase
MQCSLEVTDLFGFRDNVSTYEISVTDLFGFRDNVSTYEISDVTQVKDVSVAIRTDIPILLPGNSK